MIGLGTIVNTAAILVGGAIGLIFKKHIKENFQDAVIKVQGLAVMFIGVSGALSGLLKIENGSLQTQGGMLLVFSLVIGTVLGELLRIEDHLDSLGDKLRHLMKAEEHGTFTEGFVTATLVVCVGAMAILGSLQDGLTGDATTLYIKSLLDLVILIIFASTLGVGSLFSAIPLFLYQGTITLLAGFLKPYLTDLMISNLSMVGSVLIFVIGINLAFGRKFKPGNMLPALLVPIIYSIILQFL